MRKNWLLGLVAWSGWTVVDILSINRIFFTLDSLFCCCWPHFRLFNGPRIECKCENCTNSHTHTRTPQIYSAHTHAPLDYDFRFFSPFLFYFCFAFFISENSMAIGKRRSKYEFQTNPCTCSMRAAQQICFSISAPISCSLALTLCMHSTHTRTITIDVHISFILQSIFTRSFFLFPICGTKLFFYIIFLFIRNSSIKFYYKHMHPLKHSRYEREQKKGTENCPINLNGEYHFS